MILKTSIISLISNSLYPILSTLNWSFSNCDDSNADLNLLIFERLDYVSPSYQFVCPVQITSFCHVQTSFNQISPFLIKQRTLKTFYFIRYGVLLANFSSSQIVNFNMEGLLRNMLIFHLIFVSLHLNFA